jgi:hypothetical protein
VPQSPEAGARVAHAQEVARVLRTNVVQGMKVEEGKYREFTIYLNLVFFRGSGEGRSAMDFKRGEVG